MLKSFVLYGLGALIFVAGAARASENCDSYSVIPGDTLRSISEIYYGVPDSSLIIYEANLAVIGGNPNTIEIGMKLAIPCLDNMQTPEAVAFLALIAPQAEPAEDMEPQFLAKAGDTPFVMQDNSGIIPEVLAAALRAGGFQNTVDIERPEDISDVLQGSTNPNALLSFPWVMPNCGDTTVLSPQSAYLCSNYTFSDPLYEITLGLFTSANSPLAIAKTASDFSGASICVPQFHTSDLLTQNGIAAAGAEIAISSDFENCLAGLDAGNYDAILTDYQNFGTGVLPEEGMVDIPAFAQKTTLHAIAYNQNSAALATIEMANSGLKQILMSGEWFEVVNEHLSKMR